MSSVTPENVTAETLSAPEVIANPYPYYAALRSQSPLFGYSDRPPGTVPGEDAAPASWAVLAHDQIAHVARNPGIFSSRDPLSLSHAVLFLYLFLLCLFFLSTCLSVCLSHKKATFFYCFLVLLSPLQSHLLFLLFLLYSFFLPSIFIPFFLCSSFLSLRFFPFLSLSPFLSGSTYFSSWLISSLLFVTFLSAPFSLSFPSLPFPSLPFPCLAFPSLPLP